MIPHEGGQVPDIWLLPSLFHQPPCSLNLHNDFSPGKKR